VNVIEHDKRIQSYVSCPQTLDATHFVFTNELFSYGPS
jgi:hypothetical protein